MQMDSQPFGKDDISDTGNKRSASAHQVSSNRFGIEFEKGKQELGEQMPFN